MIIVIPCAGYGTRLQEVSGDVHKSLIDVGGKPLLSRIIGNLRILEPEKIVVVTNDRFFPQFIEWKDAHSEDVELVNDGTRNNDERLGTIKDILLGLKDHDAEFVVYLGDNLLMGDLKKPLQQFTERQKSVIMLYDIKDLVEARKFGVIKIDENNKISHVEEKPPNPQSSLVSTGIYFMASDIKDAMKEFISNPENPEAFGFFLWNTYKEREYYGYVLDDSYEWIDIGSPESLERARKLFQNMQN